LELTEKITRMILVDSDNLLGTKREIEERLDEIEFLKFLANNQKSQIYYYFVPRQITLLAEEAKDPFVGFMEFLFNELRPALEKKGHFFKTFISRDNIDSKIVTDIARLLLRGKKDIKEIILISGDGDFAEILELAKEEGIKIIVVAGKKTCSRKLKEVAQEVFYVEDLIGEHSELILQH